MFENKEDTIRMIRNNLKYAITENTAFRDVYSLEKQILSLEEESENLMTMMSSTGGDTDRFLLEIENNFKKIKILREQLQIANAYSASDAEADDKIKAIEKRLSDEDVSFDEFDNIVVRRLVECIRVIKGEKIVVILKGGVQTEENLK